MNDSDRAQRGVELLQELGLKEYEARCLVSLSRLPEATAKEIAEVSEVPRTRVYDAVRVLETKGLVEKQHSNPQRFRAVPVDEAAATLQAEYEDRVDALRESLRGLGPVPREPATDESHEVWSLTGSAGIATRTRELVDEADDEVVIVVSEESLFGDELLEALERASDRGLDVVVGTVDDTVREVVAERLPEAQVFVSGLEWVHEGDGEDDVRIGRLLLIDRDTLLVSSIREDGDAGEQAVFGRGFTNGLVVIVRRLLATGLLDADDPGTAA